VPAAPPPGLRAALTMLFACVCFAAMSLAIGVAHRAEPGLSSLASSAVRSVVNLVVIVGMARGDGALLFGDRRPALWMRGVAGAVALTTYFASLARVGIGEAAFLNATSTFWVAALAPMLLGERGRLTVWVAVLASVVGTALLAAPRLDGADTVGRVLGAISGLAAAFAYLGVRRAAGTNPPQVIVFYFVAASTVVCAVLALFTPVQWPNSAGVWGALVVAGLAATGGQLLMTRAYQLGEAAPIAVLSTATPLFTTAAGVWVLHETPDANARLGMLILAAFGVGLPLLDGALSRERATPR
jgi:S-adenosylmethionine uptake transporter